MNYKIEFGFGAEVDKNHERLESEARRHAVMTIRETATQLFGGCTLWETIGSWKSPDGHIYRERGATLMVILLDDYHNSPIFDDAGKLRAKIHAMVETIKDSLNQEAVAITATPLAWTGIV